MYVLLGLIIGVLAAVPIGPVNVFIVSQTLKRDLLHGILGGLTAAFLDFLYCLAAIIGIIHISINVKPFLPFMKLLAAALLAVLGVRLLRQAKSFPDKKTNQSQIFTSHRPVFGVLLLYVTNPTLTIFWLGIGGFVTTHAWVMNTGWPPYIFALACGLGGSVWYLLLVSYFSKHQEKLRPKTFGKVLTGLAIVLFCFSAYALISLVF